MSSSNCLCSSCGIELNLNDLYSHPILRSPTCLNCIKIIRIKKVNSCVWCGISKDSERNSIPEYVNCSICSSKFCIYCLTRNLGEVEMGRIAFQISEQWKCFICLPEPLEKIAILKNWKKFKQRIRAPRKGRRNLISEDISLGRESIPIECFNEYDDTSPQPFTYVCQPIPGNTSALKCNPNFISCCTCTDNCRDPNRCECAKLMGGIMYDEDGILINDPPGGIYECNSLCSCNRNRCQNRIVGKGSQQKLQVFKCPSKGKGWGVRAMTDIPAGTYVTSYLGELLHESDCETRGIKHGDEYLFALDAWGRSRGCERLSQLGLKWEQQPRHQILADYVGSSSLSTTSTSSTTSASISTSSSSMLSSFSSLAASSSSSNSSSSPLLTIASSTSSSPTPTSNSTSSGISTSTLITTNPTTNSTYLLSQSSTLSSSNLPANQMTEEGIFTSIFPGLCDAATMTQSEISSIIGKDLFNKICKSNAVLRCNDHILLCGGKRGRTEELDDALVSGNVEENGTGNVTEGGIKIKTEPTKKDNNNSNSVGVPKRRRGVPRITVTNSTGERRRLYIDEFVEEYGRYLPSQKEFKRRWLEEWQEARSYIIDKVQLETETINNTFTIDAK